MTGWRRRLRCRSRGPKQVERPRRCRNGRRRWFGWMSMRMPVRQRGSTRGCSSRVRGRSSSMSGSSSRGSGITCVAMPMPAGRPARPCSPGRRARPMTPAFGHSDLRYLDQHPGRPTLMPVDPKRGWDDAGRGCRGSAPRYSREGRVVRCNSSGSHLLVEGLHSAGSAAFGGSRCRTSLVHLQDPPDGLSD